MQNGLPNCSNSLNRIPPDSDELEISLFGPGVGECVVVHLGDNNWMVVDSCLNSATGNPVAVEYLKSLGIDPGSTIKLFVISHWHNDHIAGASQIVRFCSETRISYSLALLKTEFLTLVESFSGKDVLLDRKTSATREFAGIIDCLKDRCGKSGDYVSKHLIPTRVDQILYQTKTVQNQVEVRALSPANQSIHRALVEIAALIPQKGDIRKIVPAPSANHNAIALWIQFGENRVLLGSDLEETADPNTGWTAIVNSPVRPCGKSRVFKVPHHGSVTGHSKDVWKEMLEPDPVAVLTTKTGGPSSLPKDTDIRRLKTMTPNIFCTNDPVTKKIKREPAVEKTMKGVVRSRKVLGGEMGQIQIRISMSSSVAVNLKHPASLL